MRFILLVRFLSNVAHKWLLFVVVKMVFDSQIMISTLLSQNKYLVQGKQTSCLYCKGYLKQNMQTEGSLRRNNNDS